MLFNNETIGQYLWEAAGCWVISAQVLSEVLLMSADHTLAFLDIAAQIM